MKAMRRIKALALFVAIIALGAVMFTMATPDTASAKPCCWVMVCTTQPPIVCWEECVPCPPLPPPPGP
ncbi:MAG: hypothetical protein GF310_09635 [candidate division Zixibacteria bacterium]|nr:hypothetical protein [candidate division Zixibacteria bacterium]